MDALGDPRLLLHQGVEIRGVEHQQIGGEGEQSRQQHGGDTDDAASNDGEDDIQALLADAPAPNDVPASRPAAAASASASARSVDELDGVMPQVPRRAWIFTSATLAVRQDFSHFTQALGLDDARCQSWSSPYDYPSQAMLYVPTGIPLPTDSGHTDAVVSVAIASDGKRLLTGSDDRTVRLWDLISGEKPQVFNGHEGVVLCVAFSPDGQTVVSGGGDKLA